jgi:hypothetical protein
VVKKLRAPFTDDCWHWAAVLALQRLGVVAVYTFVGETVTRAVCQVLVMMCSLVVHVGGRPFAQPLVQHVQTALLGLLVLIALLNAPLAALQTSAFAPLPSSPMHGIIDQVRTAEAVLLVAPGIAFAAVVVVGLWLERAAVVRGAAALACGAMQLCTAPCRFVVRKASGAARGQKQQLNAPLLSSVEEEEEPVVHGEEGAAAGADKNPKLVGNARGLRLAFTSHA